MIKASAAIRMAVISAVSCLLINPLPAVAQEQAWMRERGSIAIGAFITNRDTSTRLSGTVGDGTDLDLESDLGLESTTTVGRLNGHLWFARKHRFDVSYFDLSRSASRRIDETIEFGDQIFEIDTVVNSTVDLTIVKTDYTFAPLNRDRGYLGITGGLYVASNKYSLSEATLGRSETESLTAPLPLIGFRGEYAVTDRITIGGASQWLSVDVGDVSGRLHDFYVGADYSFGRRMAVGLAFNEVKLNVRSSDTGGFEGSLDWGYDGWLLYTRADFGR